MCAFQTLKILSKESKILKVANISKGISAACYTGGMHWYPFPAVTCIKNLWKP